MKTSNAWSFRSIGVKMMMGMVLAAMIGSINVAPAIGKNDKRDNGRYEHRGPVYGSRDYRPYGYPYRYYGQYGYGEQAYPPPPVIYAPPPPPGIGIFFPPIFIR